MGNGNRRRSVWGSIFGWTVFILALGLIGFVAFRTWFFVVKIKTGALLDLPQFSQKATFVPGSREISAKIVDRSLVESADSPTLGSDNPKLTIVEFADFQCPYSRDAAMTIRTVMAKYGDRVRLIFRNFPITEIHPDAYQAAIAGECALEQDKFWQYHDRLFAQSSSLGYDALIKSAESVGMDRKQFELCLAGNRYKDKVDADISASQVMGLRGTPTFVFDGQIVEGDIPIDTFESIIQRMAQ